MEKDKNMQDQEQKAETAFILRQKRVKDNFTVYTILINSELEVGIVFRYRMKHSVRRSTMPMPMPIFPNIALPRQEFKLSHKWDYR